MSRPFEGLLVLDLTHVLAGPFCSYQLALLGARTIKVEAPGKPDPVRGRGPDDALNAVGMGINYLTQGANKEALSLNLKLEEGRKIFKRLVADADVLVENYRAGALDALGLGWQQLSEVNPRLIYCSLTGFGQSGPRAGVNAYDNVIQAASGLMHQTGNEITGPIKTGASIIDYTAGFCAAFAVASALFQRARTGTGQRIDCAMFDAALTLMGPELVAAQYRGPKVSRPAEAGIGCYRTLDGLLMLGAFNDRQSRRLWEALGRHDLAARQGWPELWSAADEMRTILAGIMVLKTSEEWETLLHGIGVPAERVRRLDDACASSQLAHRQFLKTLPGFSGTTFPVQVPVAAFSYDHGGPEITSAPPRMAQHTDEILKRIGYSPESIAALRDQGVV